MFEHSEAASSFSVDDIDAARGFYGATLGVPMTEENGMLWLHISGGGSVFIYPKGPGHSPASFTILNFSVPDAHAAVAELTAKGVEILRYPGMEHAEDGVMTGGGPLIAWFADPAGNVLSVIER